MPTERVGCPSCGTTYKVNKDRIGRKARCLKCQHEFFLQSGFSKSVPVNNKNLPLYAEDLNNHAVAMLYAGNYEKAGKLFEQALKIDPHHLESSYNYGLMLWRSGIIDDLELVSQIKEIRTCFNNGWKKEYLLGLIHLERSDSESAVKAFEKADRLEPHNLDIKDVLEKAKSGIGKRIRCVKTLGEHDYYIYKVSISPDGKYAISVCLVGENLEECYEDSDRLTSIGVWDLGKGKCLQKLEEISGGISALAFTPDGKYVLLGNGDGTLILWDPLNEKFIQKFEGHKNSCAHPLAISSDGKYAISGGRSLKLWNLGTGDLVRTLDESSNRFGSIAVDPTCSYVVSSANKVPMHPFWGGGEIKLWEISSGRCLQELHNNDEKVIHLNFDSNGRHIVSCSYKNIKIWDLQTGKCLSIFEGPNFQISFASVDLDKRFALLATKNGKMSLFDLNSGQVKRSFGVHNGGETVFSISSDKKHVVTGSADKKLRLWELTTYPFKAKFMQSRAFGNEEKLEFINKFSILIKNADKKIKEEKFQEANNYLKEASNLPGYRYSLAIFQLKSHFLKTGLHSELKTSWCIRTFETGSSPVLISANGKYALTGGPELKYWDMSTRRCLRTFGEHSQKIASAAISPDGKSAVSVESGDPTISQAEPITKFRVWDLNAGKCLKEIQGHSGWIVALAISPDGRCVLSGNRFGTLNLWDMASGKCLMTYKEGRHHFITAVSFSPDGRCAISGSIDKTLKLWDVASGKCLRTYEGHSKPIKAVCFSPDGKYVLSGSGDNSLKLWDVASGKCLRTFEGHSDYVSSVAISPNGKFVFSGSWDKTIKIWELLTGKCLSTLRGHIERIDSIAISPDGKRLLSGSPELPVYSNPTSQLLKLWHIDWNYEFPEEIGWDEQVRPYLEIFLEKYKGNWTENNWENFKRELQLRGFGWVSSKEVRNKLEELTSLYLKNGEKWLMKRYGIKSK
jgi:predicted Zn finger-like uncharacterized protein